MNRSFRRLTRSRALTSILVCACAQGGLCIPARAQDAPRAPSKEELRKGLAEGAACLKAIQSLRGTLDSTRYDLAALAASLNKSDPDRCFEFVRDQILIEPYAGSLRGPKGTLLARAGNTLDRALLMADLVTRSGKVEARIARGKLGRAQADKLLSQVRYRLGQHPAEGSFDPAPVVAKLADETGIDRARWKALDATTEERAARLSKELEARTAADVALLTSCLNGAGIQLGPGACPGDESLIGSLADHYWVRIREAGGKWRDLDPTFYRAKPGEVHAKAEAEFAPKDLPVESRHRIEVRIVLERVNGKGALEEVVVFAKPFDAAECAGKSFEVAFLPAMSANEIRGLPAMKEDDRYAALEKAARIQPIIAVGGHVSPGRPFDLNGETFNVQPNGVLGGGDLGSVIAQSGVGAAIGQLGRVAGAADGSSAAAKSSALASVRIEWVVTEPGRASETHVRTLVDRVPAERRGEVPIVIPDRDSPAARRATMVELVRSWTGSVTAGWINETAVIAMRAHDLEVSLDGLGRATAALVDEKPVDRRGAPEPCRCQQPLLLGYELARQAELDARAARASCVAYYAGPSLVFNVVGLRARRDDGRPVATVSGFDVITNPVRFLRSKSGKGGEDAGLLALEQGVADTQLERLASSAPDKANNASNVFAAALRENVPLVTLKPEEASRVAALELPESARALLRRELAAGNVVVVPARPVGDEQGVAWWRIDRETGRTLGMVPQAGGSLVESACLQAIGSSFRDGLLTYLVCMLVIVLVQGGSWTNAKQEIYCALMGVAAGSGGFAARLATYAKPHGVKKALYMAAKKKIDQIAAYAGGLALAAGAGAGGMSGPQ